MLEFKLICMDNYSECIKVEEKHFLTTLGLSKAKLIMTVIPNLQAEKYN